MTALIEYWVVGPRATCPPVDGPAYTTKVGGNQHYSRVFYMAPSLIRGVCLLVNYWNPNNFQIVVYICHATVDVA